MVFSRSKFVCDDVVVFVLSSFVRNCKISSMLEKRFVLVLLHSDIPLPKLRYKGVVDETISSLFTDSLCRFMLLDVDIVSKVLSQQYLRFGENEGVGVAQTMGVDAIVLVVKQVVSKSNMIGEAILFAVL